MIRAVAFAHESQCFFTFSIAAPDDCFCFENWFKKNYKTIQLVAYHKKRQL